MEKDKRQGWLKDLKVGDEVFVEYIGNSDSYDGSMFGVVSRITPTGRIVVSRKNSNEMMINIDETQYSPEGYHRNGPFPTRIVGIIPELKERFRESFIRDVTTTINDETLHSFSLNSLEILLDCLEMFKKITK